MAENHVIVAGYAAGGYTKTRPAFQYDYGQELQLQGFPEGMLPASFEMHFSIGMGQAITRIGTNGAVAVPNACLERFGTLTAWLFLHDAETDGETKYVIEIPVRSRAKTTDQEPTPEEQSVITEAIAALNAGVTAAEAAQAAAEAAAESVGEAAEQAQGKAGEAAASATAAAGSAASADGAARAAGSAATAANGSATAAAGSASAAAGSAEAAAGSATAAAESAAAAAQTVAGIEEAGAAQVLAVNTAGAAKVDAINTAGTEKVNAINTAGTEKVNAVNTAGAAQVQAVEAKGEEVIEEIPADYSTLSADVTSLKSAISGMTSATASDEGKALKAKTVSGGKVTEWEFGDVGGGGLTSDIKAALLACLAKVAWVDDNGQNYYDALEAALYPPVSLVSISAVYTQSGTVYTTDSLDSLKANLVVTALYDDITSEPVTSYTLSGTLTEGTSTITVSYGGKTTTFTVTVSVWSTLPVIAAADEYYASDGTTGSKSGMSRTALYEYDIDIDSLKAHAYYNTENNYMKNAGSVFVIKYYMTNPDNLTGYSVCKHVYFSGNTFVYYGSVAVGELKTLSDARYMSAILSDSKLKIGFSLFTAGIDDAYAYFDTTVTGIMPEGINAGDIIFAGANTPYYNKHNISEVSS